MYNGILEYIKPWTTLVVDIKYENINKMTIHSIKDILCMCYGTMVLTLL
jgi:hypothetical protein